MTRTRHQLFSLMILASLGIAGLLALRVSTVGAQGDVGILNPADSCILTVPQPGLDLAESFFLTQPAAGEVNEAQDEFSRVVLTGDFNGDGIEELAVGTPGEDGGSGAVSIFHGSEGGIISGSVITLTALGDMSAAGDRFGAALEAGDFNLDGFEDLVVGAPGRGGSGAVYILPGSLNGLGASFLGITPSDAAPGDGYGAALAVADFSADDYPDLTVGAPGRGGSGAAFVYPGSEEDPFVFSGPLQGAPEVRIITQVDAGDTGAPWDQFGASLVNGDFSADGFDDLVVGAPGKDAASGAVYLCNGDEGLSETCELVDPQQALAAGDQFGAALEAAVLDGDLSEELVVGAPGRHGSGAVLVYPGALTDENEEVVTEAFYDVFVITQTDAGGVDELGDRFGAALANGDFSGNDIEDLAVGAPGEDGGAGAVSLFFGEEGFGADGIPAGVPVTQGNAVEKLLDDDDESDGDSGGAQQVAFSMFGAAVGAGDFNGDGFEELAVGAPGQDQSGAVYVYPAFAVSPAAINQEHAGGVNEKEDEFGTAEAVGDFNGDGIEDLAVGAPGEHDERGAVYILPGSPDALTRGCFITHADADGVAEDDDGEENRFGAALTVGNFNDDGYDDLAVGAPGRDNERGGVFVFPGSEAGITRGYLIDQSDADEDERGAGFGAALAVGDFDFDGFDDLAVGAPWQDGNEGAVFIFSGSVAGISTGFEAGDDDDDFDRMHEDYEYFGAALTAGDLNRDDFVDLAVGAPGSDESSGAVFILPGSAAGITTGYVVTQTAAGELDEAGDRFGAALAAGDFDGDGFAELAVGAPREAPGLGPESGIVFIFSDSGAGIRDGFSITQADTDAFYPGSVLIAVPEANEEGDRFGEVLLAADFDRDGVDSLVVGAPGEAPGPWPKSGLVFFFRGVEEDGIRTRGQVIEAGEEVADFNFVYTQESYGGENEKGDNYGSALAAGDFDGDEEGHRDLAVGASGEAPGLDPRSGGINIIPFVEIEL